MLIDNNLSATGKNAESCGRKAVVSEKMIIFVCL